MKAIVFHGIGDIRLDDVPEPTIQDPGDAIVRITRSAICGTDLHMIRGTLPGMRPGTILGHEGVGVVEEVGPDVRNFVKGDRVVIPSTICCGSCSYCRAGYQAQCDVANPKGHLAGTCFFGGPEQSGAIPGLQAEFARVPFAYANLVRLPDDVDDDQAILLSDVFPTGWFAAHLAEIGPGDTVAVFGCGPVGQLAIICAQELGADRVLAVDCIPSRLDMAREHGAEVIHFEEEDPVEAIRRLTGNIGVDRAIDAVGVDAVRPHRGPVASRTDAEKDRFDREVREIAPESQPGAPRWQPGDAPSLALEWAVNALCKAGTLSVVGLYPLSDRVFPIGLAMNKNLTLKMGNCNHRRYIPLLMDMIRAGVIEPTMFLTHMEPLTTAVGAYEAFEQRQPGWIKVELAPPAVA